MRAAIRVPERLENRHLRLYSSNLRRHRLVLPSHRHHPEQVVRERVLSRELSSLLVHHAPRHRPPSPRRPSKPRFFVLCAFPSHVLGVGELRKVLERSLVLGLFHLFLRGRVRGNRGVDPGALRRVGRGRCRGGCRWGCQWGCRWGCRVLELFRRGGGTGSVSARRTLRARHGKFRRGGGIERPRRLLRGLEHVVERRRDGAPVGRRRDEPVLVTVPGVGARVFSGDFRGPFLAQQLHAKLPLELLVQRPRLIPDALELQRLARLALLSEPRGEIVRDRLGVHRIGTREVASHANLSLDGSVSLLPPRHPQRFFVAPLRDGRDALEGHQDATQEIVLLSREDPLVVVGVVQVELEDLTADVVDPGGVRALARAVRFLLLLLLLVETATVRCAAQRAHHHPLVVHRPLARQRALLDVRPEPVVAVERASEEPGPHPQPFFPFGVGRLVRLCLSRLFFGFGASRGSDRGIADHGVDDRAQEPAPRPLRIPHLRPGGRVHSKVKVVVPLGVERGANRLRSVRLILAAVPALNPLHRPRPRAKGADHVRVARTTDVRRLDVPRPHHPHAQLRLAPVLPEAHQVQLAGDAPVLGVHAPLVLDGRRAAVALASLGQRRQR